MRGAGFWWSLFLAGCLVPAPDFTGKICSEVDPCPAGWSCRSSDHTCRLEPEPPVQIVHAFPGACGGGAQSLGGRGGPAMLVTTLADSGPGSLRACLTASGPRTCVFRVGGVIEVASRMQVSNPYLTVAGQTAPGGGITLHWAGAADTVLFVSTHDVVVRFVTCRIGLGTHTPGAGTGASCFQIANGDNHDIVFDHLSASWWDSAALHLLSNYEGPNRRVSVQNSMFYESSAGHPVCMGSSGRLGVSDQEVDIDFHHNLFSGLGFAVPELDIKSTRWVNNLIYNWSVAATMLHGGVSADLISNRYKPGPLNSTANPHEVNASLDGTPENPGPPLLYLSGNVGPNQADPRGDQWLMTAQIPAGGGAEDAPGVPASWQRTTPLPAQPVPIAVDDANSLEAALLPSVGNSQGLDCLGHWFDRRDQVDRRIVSEYQAGTAGGLFTVEDAAHRVPTVEGGTPCLSASNDGIPDPWATAHGLAPGDPAKSQGDAGDGSTWLEHYLNGQ